MHGPPHTLDEESAAHMLFGAENPPGTEYVSGSQDALGLMLQGVSKLYYTGKYWPATIERLSCKESVAFLERVLWLVPMPSRPEGYDPLTTKNLQKEYVEQLAQASDAAWQAIQERNAADLGKALTNTRRAWKLLLPRTVPAECEEFCEAYSMHHGSLFTGAGGGYLMVIADGIVKNGFRVRISSPQLSIWTKRNIR